MGAVNLYRLPELLSLQVFNTTEKQWYRPNMLPGIAYPFELKGGVCPLLTRTKM